MPGHIHICMRIPPKYFGVVSDWFHERQSAITIARQFVGKEKNYTGEHFWARGYAVSTVGFELEAVKKYIREQEASDEQG